MNVSYRFAVPSHEILFTRIYFFVRVLRKARVLA